MNLEKQELYIEGIECSSCEITIEKALEKYKDITKVKANSNNKKLTFYTNKNNGLNKEHLKEEINKYLINTDYKVETIEEEKKKLNTKELFTAFLISTIILLVFIVLQNSGILNLINTETITYPVIFSIGIVASLSTCMAIVGGLVLTISTSYAKYSHTNKLTPLIHFHIARLASFFVLGGLIGKAGELFEINQKVTIILNVFLIIVMTVMGIDMLGVTKKVKHLKLRMPKFITKNLIFTETANYITPIILGIGTFFLPCGFTQSMQFYTLTTGSFIVGGLTMLVFALGTLPALALISMASIKLSKKFASGLFFKTAGFLIIFFAIFNTVNTLKILNII